jgi:hypothetical protein
MKDDYFANPRMWTSRAGSARHENLALLPRREDAVIANCIPGRIARRQRGRPRQCQGPNNVALTRGDDEDDVFLAQLRPDE